MLKLRSLALLLWFCTLLPGHSMRTAQENLPTLYIQPTWSPDGQSIAYATNEGWYVMDRNGDNVRQVTPPQRFEGWTADSSALISQDWTTGETPYKWWLYPVDGSERQPLLPEFENIYRLVYAPDNSRIAIYGQYDATDQVALWLADVDQSNLMLLADEVIQNYDIQQMQWTAKPGGLILTAALKSTGKMAHLYLPVDQPIESINQLTIERLRSENTLYFGGGWQLNFDPLKGGTTYAYFVRSASNPAFNPVTINRLIYGISLSPNRQFFVYVSYCDPDTVPSTFLQGEWSAVEQAATPTSLRLLNLHDRRETTLVECGTGSQIWASFSPDNSSVVFVTAAPDAWGINRVDLLPDGTFTINDITPG